MIRTLDKFSGRTYTLAAHGNARADGNPLPVAHDGHGLRPDPLGDLIRFGGVAGERENYKKLLTTETAANIRISHLFYHHLGQLDEYAISFLVTVPVVDQLEVVDVHQDQ